MLNTVYRIVVLYSLYYYYYYYYYYSVNYLMAAWLLCCRWCAALLCFTSIISAFLLASKRPTEPAKWLIVDHVDQLPDQYH